MDNLGKILWVDDEVDLLQAHVMFLKGKGYEVKLINNGQDAIELCKTENFDIIFLDENMPGLSGLETLEKIKFINSSIPVVMITKSEEENIMDMAIGSQIADYLIKPVNPNQILLTIKKNVHKHNIVQEQTTNNYRTEFNEIGMLINDARTFDDWREVYRKIVYWELELTATENDMNEMLKMQKNDANRGFSKFIRQNYISWIEDSENRPILSTDIFKKKIFPLLDAGEKVFYIVIDNFRLDQWKMIKKMLSNLYVFDDEDIYSSILPTATQYARNAMFSGLLPLQLKKMFPQYWVDEEGEDAKNQFEKELLQTQIDRFRKKYTISYHKVNEAQYGEKLVAQAAQLDAYQLNVIVYNFVDMLSHMRTESKMIKELAGTEAAYRSLTLSWFQHSSLYEMLKILAQKEVTVVITTDHGTVSAENPVKVIGDKVSTNVNLRYKVGRMLSYNPKEVFEITQPSKIGLNAPNLTSTYIFATNHDYLVYPNNYNQFANYYKDTFQHGGISMEEMMIPLVTLRPKRRK
ncbi:MAG: bifunctional response regulator/alkaline phosphatase family protein [Bacteroidales bacterium]|nr:bifunctional response regulator/alkaline phosphatase family protein [Bacteroidales bacterium]